MQQLPCSDVEVEPLPGTAKPGSVYVLFEWPEAWPRDVMGDAALGEELTAKLAPMLEEHDATLLLIRHPTREGRNITDHHLYLVFADEAVTEVKHIDSPEELLELDLSGPGRNGAERRERPLLNELHARYPFGPGNDVVWETSHIKGHRFAPTMLLMPWAYSFGRMNIEATDAMLADASAGRYFVPGNRGRGTLGPAEQVAELAAAAEVSGARYGQFEVAAFDGGSVLVTDTAAGQAYEVQLEQRPVSGVVDSCGKAPKESTAWVAASVTPRR